MDISWGRISSRLYRMISGRPFLIVAAAGLLGLVSILYISGNLEFWTERNVLMAQDSPTTTRYREYRQEFPDDYLVIVLSSKDLDASKRFASLLGEKLEQDPSPVKDLFFRIPAESFERQALLFLEPEEIRKLGTRIAQHQDLLLRLASSPDLTVLLKTINQRISRALVRTAVSGLFAEDDEEEAEQEAKDRVDPEDLRFLSSLMDSLLVWVRDAPRYGSPWGVFLGGAGGLSEDGYLVDEERGWVFVFAYLKEVEASFNREGVAIERIRELIDEVSEKIPGVTVGITGTPALNSDEMASSLEDMTWAMVLALVLVTVIFIVGFGETRRPLLAVLVLGLGVVWTLGWLCLTVGHLTILSMAFGSILIGLGIDFGIHLVARYETEQRLGLGSGLAMEKSLQRVGRAILSGGLTTAAAFMALGLSRFRGIKEFGWIAGWGVLFCLVAALVVLPTLLMLMDRNRGHRDKKAGVKPREPLLERIVAWPARYPRWSLVLAAGVSIPALFSWEKIKFDYNLLHLQAEGTEAVEWEHRLLEAQGNSSIFAVDMVDTLEEARRKAEQYEQLSLVSKVESLASFLPADPARRMEEISLLKPLLEDVVIAREARPPPSSRRIQRWLAKIRFKLREEEDKSEDSTAAEDIAALPPPDTISGARARTEEVLRALEAEEGAAADLKLARYQERLFSDFQEKMRILLMSLDPLPVTREGLPDLIKKRFLGTTGKWLLQIYPKEDVWEHEAQRPFVEQIRSVDERVTGTAVVNYESTKSLLDAYLQGGMYAVGAIIVILFLDFRRPLLVCLALVPLAMAALWSLLGMRLLGIAFNPANLVIMPLLVGIGVDNGIHVVRHFLGSHSSDHEIAGSSTGRAITLSTLTTISGFGSLMVARHQGIYSIGALLTLAMTSCLLASLVVLPSVLRLLPSRTRDRIWRQGQPRRRKFE